MELTNDDTVELSGIEAKLMMAEYANLDQATMLTNMLGAGLSLIPPGPSSFFVVVFLSVPARLTGPHSFRLELVDEHGNSDLMPSLEGQFQVHSDDVEIVTPAFPIGVQQAFPAGGSFEWRLWLDGHTHSSWRASFRTMGEREQ